MKGLLRWLVLSTCVALAPSVVACRQAPKHVDKTPPVVLDTPTENDPDLSVPSEIYIERINSGCIDCGDHSISLSRTKHDKFASAVIVYTDLHTKKERRGELSAGYYNRLLQLAKTEKVMKMDDTYAMGWEDAQIVKMTVTIGSRRKTIR